MGLYKTEKKKTKKQTKP